MTGAVATAEKPTKLNIARDLLADEDFGIISLLLHFEPAANPIERPSSADLYRYLEINPLPQDVTNMIIATNTPVELVAALTQRISRKSRKEKVEEFKNLAQAICNRHKHTRLVAEHKMENPNTPRDEVGNIITYVDWQHKNVERRAVAYATQVGNTREKPVMDPAEINLETITDKFELFALGVIRAAAHVGASIQYDIINSEPKGEEPAGARYNIRYPTAEAA